MNLIRLIRTAPVEVNWLAGTSAFALVIKIFILNAFAQIISGANALGGVIEGLLSSIIASYIFYLIVVHLKETSGRSVLYPYLSMHSKRIVGVCIGQLDGISKYSGETIELGNITKDNLELAFSKIPPYSQAPLIIDIAGTYANWFQYFNYNHGRSKESTRKLLDQFQFLQAKHVALICAIDDCNHFTRISGELGLPFNNLDLSVWASTFYDYCMLCSALESYNHKFHSQEVF